MEELLKMGYKRTGNKIPEVTIDTRTNEDRKTNGDDADEFKPIINSPFHKVFDLEHSGGLRRSRSYVGKGLFLRVSPSDT